MKQPRLHLSNSKPGMPGMQCKAGLQVAVPMRHGVVEKQTQACREAQNRVLFFMMDLLCLLPIVT